MLNKEVLFAGVILAVFGVCGVSSLPASAKSDATQASSAVRSINSSVAAGRNQQQTPYVVELLPGHGVNLSFIPTGETVTKVWLDNPSFVTLDADGCLQGLGRECKQEGAQVLHLRRITQLNIKGLPKTNSSLLTVVTNGTAGRRVYLFRVVAANSEKVGKTAHTVEVLPDNVAPNTMSPLVADTQVDISQVRLGLMIALNRRLITKDSVLWNRIINFLRKERSGESIPQAAQNSGISMQLLTKLQELGTSATPNVESLTNE